LLTLFDEAVQCLDAMDSFSCPMFATVACALPLCRQIMPDIQLRSITGPQYGWSPYYAMLAVLFVHLCARIMRHACPVPISRVVSPSGTTGYGVAFGTVSFHQLIMQLSLLSCQCFWTYQHHRFTVCYQVLDDKCNTAALCIRVARSTHALFATTTAAYRGHLCLLVAVLHVFDFMR
jgi:hypothetical protein